MLALKSSILLFVALSLFGCGSGTKTPPPPVQTTVTVAAKRLALAAQQSASLSATTNDSGGVTWTATGGTLSATSSLSGVGITYTAPATAGSYTVTATSVSSASTSAATTVFVTDLAGVYTYHNDLARDGVNSKEVALSPSTINAASFGRLFSCPVDGVIYAQPLWVAQLPMTVSGTSAKHNVVFVATQHDSLYAFDADASPCLQLWKVSLIATDHGATAGETPVPSAGANRLVGSGYGDIAPEVGVTGTPVIDPATGTLYVVSKSADSTASTIYQRLHAIDIATGSEKLGGPANIGAGITYPGTGDGGTTVLFNPQQQHQRAGLALVNGVVYVAWASHEDTLPYYGWVVGFKASDLSVKSVVNVSPNVQFGGIWMGGGAPSVDSDNNLYVITGNATFDATSPTAPNNDYGDSFLKLSTDLAVSSYFTPSDQQSDATNDADFGSGGSSVVLNLATGTVRHLLIGGGKDGTLYVLDGDKLGGAGDSNARQAFNIGNSLFATGAFWNNSFYIAPVGAPLKAYSYDPATNLFNTAFQSQSPGSYGFPGATPSVSAAGNSNGIVWALDNSLYCTPQSPGCGPAVLHAYSAPSVATELWNSSITAGDAAGFAVKFTVPTIANGHVYVGTRGNSAGDVVSSTTVPGELEVYGIKAN